MPFATLVFEANYSDIQNPAIAITVFAPEKEEPCATQELLEWSSL